MENEIVYIKLDDIIPNRFQPREVFEEEALQKLADSIRQHGVIEPIIVRPISNKYEIIAGERRYKASVLAGLTTIPAIIKPMDDKESSIVAYIENEHRSGVSAIEEARTIDRILKSNNMTQEELAKQLGINQSTLANKLRLLSLPPEIQNALMHSEISERHARSLLSVKDEQKQIELLNKIKTNKMTVRELDSEIKSMNNNMNNDFNSFNNNFGGFNPNNGFAGQPANTPPISNNYPNTMGPMATPSNDMFNSMPTANSTPVNDFAFNNPVQAVNNVSTQEPFISSPADNGFNNDFNQYLNTPVNEPVTPPVSESTPNTNNDFMSFLNDYNTNPVSEPQPPVNSAPLFDNLPPTAPVADSMVPNTDTEPDDGGTQDPGFMSFLNNYDSNKPINEPEVPSAPVNAPATDTGTTDPGFMNFLDNYDNANPLPPEDNDAGETGNGGLNVGNYLNEIPSTPNINNNISQEPNNNVTLNSVTPPITSPMDVNSYVEDSSQFVDVSKASVIGSVDEIIDKLKVTVDDIKAKSKFKVDTDEINYDDIYQITIRIDKRDF